MMTESIWKFPLRLDGVQEVMMPQGADILTVQVQHGMPCIWAKVNVNHPQISVTIWMYGTGHRHDTLKGKYVGTIQMDPLVIHVYAEVQP